MLTKNIIEGLVLVIWAGMLIFISRKTPNKKNDHCMTTFEGFIFGIALSLFIIGMIVWWVIFGY